MTTEKQQLTSPQICRSRQFSATLTFTTSEPVETELLRTSINDALAHLDPYITEYTISGLMADGSASP